MMSALTRLIAIGQPAAGDDGVGIAIAQAFHKKDLPDTIETHQLTDATRLIDLLSGVDRVILIDAVVDSDAVGQIVCLTVDELTEGKVTPLSGHGTNIVQAIKLAQTLAPNTTTDDICIVGVTIARPREYTYQMSPAVAVAIPRAVSLIREMIEN